MKYRLAAISVAGAIAVAFPVVALANPGLTTGDGMHEWMTDEFGGAGGHDGMHEWMTDEFGGAGGHDGMHEW
ncbi:MAG: hypothetical protein KJ956_12410, partial [Actinobacteria bacterium]|nr:hypothetical protein [Actinomycetota bacterium]